MKDILKSIRYFAAFDDEKLEKLANISRIRKLNIGEVLFYEDDEPRYVYYLHKGFLKILKNQGGLKQVYINTLGPGTFVAELTLFEKMNYPATTEALYECEVLAIDKEQFIIQFFNDVGLLQEMLKSLSLKVKYLMRSIELETTITTDIKIAKYIIDNQKSIDTIRNKDIGIKLNTTSETVSRILKKFVKSGLLASSSPIKIKDLEGLKILCN